MKKCSYKNKMLEKVWLVLISPGGTRTVGWNKIPIFSQYTKCFPNPSCSCWLLLMPIRHQDDDDAYQHNNHHHYIAMVAEEPWSADDDAHQPDNHHHCCLDGRRTRWFECSWSVPHAPASCEQRWKSHRWYFYSRGIHIPKSQLLFSLRFVVFSSLL